MREPGERARAGRSVRRGDQSGRACTDAGRRTGLYDALHAVFSQRGWRKAHPRDAQRDGGGRKEPRAGGAGCAAGRPGSGRRRRGLARSGHGARGAAAGGLLRRGNGRPAGAREDALPGDALRGAHGDCQHADRVFGDFLCECPDRRARGGPGSGRDAAGGHDHARGRPGCGRTLQPAARAAPFPGRRDAADDTVLPCGTRRTAPAGGALHRLRAGIANRVPVYAAGGAGQGRGPDAVRAGRACADGLHRGDAGDRPHGGRLSGRRAAHERRAGDGA